MVNIRIKLGWILLLLMFLAGCGDKVFTERFYSGDINTNDLVGYWIITEDSARLLADKCSCGKTNRSDHILVLNPSNTCVARCYPGYSTIEFSRHVRGEEEEKKYNTRLEDALAAGNNKAQYDFKTWYAWNPTGEDIISGPYVIDLTNMPVVHPGKYMLNLWHYWSLEDGKKRGSYFKTECDFSSSRYRYKLGFADAEAMYVVPEDLFYIGMISNKISIWSPIVEITDGVDLKGDTIRFKKVTKQELINIVHKEYGVASNSSSEGKQN